MSEYVVVSFVGNRVRPSFRRTDWPLHVTLLSPFLTEHPPERLTDKALIVAFKHTSFSVPAKEKAFYGRKGDVAATTLDLTQELRLLHSDLLETFRHDVEFKTARFNGDGYSPHVSDQRTGAVGVGTLVPIKTLSLVHLFGKVGRVISNLPLS